MAGLDEGALAETVRSVNVPGEPDAEPRWRILVHQATDAARLRSEGELGQHPLDALTGWPDFLCFLDATRGDGPES